MFLRTRKASEFGASTKTLTGSSTSKHKTRTGVCGRERSVASNEGSGKEKTRKASEIMAILITQTRKTNLYTDCVSV